jgi:putative Ca2+/H+ antiporter (TMEM165/GDT1 family)
MATALAHASFAEGFSKSAVMVLVSEIGDKTFFIAAIMAMRNPQLTVRSGALGAPSGLAA